MNNAFGLLIGKLVVVYLDNIIIYSKDCQKHLDHLWAVLDVLRKHKLVAKPSRCEFLKEELLFLGHFISQHGIEPDPNKTKEVSNIPPPKDTSQLCTFLDMIAYIRRFIPNFGELIAPLTELLNTKAKYEWTPAFQQAFKILKDKLVNAPVLQF